ncbi:MAG: hypothetical protein WCG83_01540 [Candidatus Peregrinibacteria bacterium]
MIKRKNPSIHRPDPVVASTVNAGLPCLKKLGKQPPKCTIAKRITEHVNHIISILGLVLVVVTP